MGTNKRQYRKTHTERRKFRLCVALQTRGKFPGSLVCLPPVCGAWPLVCWSCLRLWRLVFSSGPCPLAAVPGPLLWAVCCLVLLSGLVVWPCRLLPSRPGSLFSKEVTTQGTDPKTGCFEGEATTQAPIFKQVSPLTAVTVFYGCGIPWYVGCTGASVSWWFTPSSLQFRRFLTKRLHTLSTHRRGPVQEPPRAQRALCGGLRFLHCLCFLLPSWRPLSHFLTGFFSPRAISEVAKSLDVRVPSPFLLLSPWSITSVLFVRRFLDIEQLQTHHIRQFLITFQRCRVTNNRIQTL